MRARTSRPRRAPGTRPGRDLHPSPATRRGYGKAIMAALHLLANCPYLVPRPCCCRGEVLSPPSSFVFPHRGGGERVGPDPAACAAAASPAEQTGSPARTPAASPIG